MIIRSNSITWETALESSKSCYCREKQLRSEDLADLLSKLSTRARNVLRRNNISTVEQLLSLSETDLSSFRNAGAKTVHELMQLQHRLQQYTSQWNGRPAPNLWEPEEWSILRKPLRALRKIPLHYSDGTRDNHKGKYVKDLGLSHGDLEALRSIAIFSHDLLDDLEALSFGILAECGISDRGFSIITSLQHDMSSGINRFYRMNELRDTPIVRACDVEGLPPAWLQIFGIPLDIAGSLHSVDIYTFQDSLGISEQDVIKRYGFSLQSLRIISQLWLVRGYSHKIKEEMPEEISIACRSFEGVWDAFMEVIAPTPRDRNIIEGRTGILEGKKWTLQELGTAEGLTRERIRQIENAIRRRARHHRNKKVLRPVWNGMEHIIWSSGGACTVSEIAESLCNCFSWPSPPTPTHVIAISELHKSFVITEEDHEYTIVSIESHPCLQCKTAKRNLIQLLESEEDGIASDRAGRVLGSQCAPPCPLRLNRTNSFSSGYVLQLASETDGVQIEESTLYSEEAWTLRFGGVLAAVEAALLTAGRAIHFSELAGELQKAGRDMSERNIHACLCQRSEVALLWDAGTYVHLEHVRIPFNLIHTIEQDAIRRLKNGLPLLSVNGLFLQYETQLRQERIPTDKALYSCLRISDNPVLTYRRYPYITLAGQISQRPTIFSVLEDFVREHEEGVALSEVKNYLVSELGVSDQLKHNYLYSILNVIQIDTGLHMHLDHLSVDPVRFRAIRNYTDQLLEGVEQVSVNKIFRDRRITCNRLGVTTPVMLYSLLQVYCSDRYELPRYPLVSRPDPTGEIGVFAQIASYVREANSPCNTDDLSAHFVDSLGFKDSAINNVRYHKDIMQYSQGIVVHMDTLKWTRSKQQAIEDIASAHLREQKSLSKPYGLLDQMFDANQLPHLPPCVPWTSTLLGELLCNEGRFQIIGTKKNAFVQIPNEHGIDDLQSLVYALLKSEYDGTANLEEFEAYLRDAGIMRKTLTSNMLGDESLVCIEGDTVLVTDLK